MFHMGGQKTPIQKTYEINVGQNSISIDFLGANRHFDWLEMSLVFYERDKHTQNLRQLQRRIGCRIYKISKNFKFH